MRALNTLQRGKVGALDNVCVPSSLICMLKPHPQGDGAELGLLEGD